MNARKFLEILHVAEKLKDTPRHCTTSKGRTESVAEHSWRISLMAMLQRHEFPEVNIDKVEASGMMVGTMPLGMTYWEDAQYTKMDGSETFESRKYIRRFDEEKE